MKNIPRNVQNKIKTKKERELDTSQMLGRKKVIKPRIHGIK